MGNSEAEQMASRLMLPRSASSFDVISKPRKKKQKFSTETIAIGKGNDCVMFAVINQGLRPAGGPAGNKFVGAAQKNPSPTRYGMDRVKGSDALEGPRGGQHGDGEILDDLKRANPDCLSYKRLTTAESRVDHADENRRARRIARSTIILHKSSLSGEYSRMTREARKKKSPAARLHAVISGRAFRVGTGRVWGRVTTTQ